MTKLDPRKLLGYKLESAAADGLKMGGKGGVKLGLKMGSKGGKPPATA